MLQVFIWPFLGKDTWGHASLEVRGGEPLGSQYISWWPDSNRRAKSLYLNSNLYCAGAFPDQTFADDVRGEDDHPPSLSITLDGKSSGVVGLDETVIKRWWSALRSNGTAEWCTLAPNCSTIVAYALTRGGGADFSDMWSRSNIVWTPNRVADYARAIRDGMAEARRGLGNASNKKLNADPALAAGWK